MPPPLHINCVFQLVMIRVPAPIARSPQFQTALKAFAKQWKAVSFFIWGHKAPRPHLRGNKRAVGVKVISS